MLKNILIWIIALSLSAVSGVISLGSISKKRAPELAISLFPENGFAAETMAATLIKASISKNEGNFPDRAEQSSSALALRAFASEPITPDAIAVIALAGGKDVRRNLMHQSFKLSRRQQLVTGWLIADSAERGDSDAILSYYDTFLRTSSSASEVIIPVLANALANSNFVKPFQTMLSRNPPWAGQFWKKVVQTPDALGNAADLRLILHDIKAEDNSYQDTALIGALVKNGQFGAATQLYVRLSTAQEISGIVKNSSFSVDSKYPPFDWQLFSTGEYGTSLNDSTLNISAVRNSGGLFARQLVELPDRMLNLNVAMTHALQDGANLNLELSCAENVKTKTTTIRIPLREKLVAKKISNEDSLCKYYWLSLRGRSSQTGDGFDISIKSIDLSIS